MTHLRMMYYTVSGIIAPIGGRPVHRLREDCIKLVDINRLTPNDPYMGHTTPLTSKHCILYIYSTNIGTEYFKHIIVLFLMEIYPFL